MRGRYSRGTEGRESGNEGRGGEGEYTKLYTAGIYL